MQAPSSSKQTTITRAFAAFVADDHHTPAREARVSLERLNRVIEAKRANGGGEGFWHNEPDCENAEHRDAERAMPPWQRDPRHDLLDPPSCEAQERCESEHQVSARGHVVRVQHVKQQRPDGDCVSANLRVREFSSPRAWCFAKLPASWRAGLPEVVFPGAVHHPKSSGGEPPPPDPRHSPDRSAKVPCRICWWKAGWQSILRANVEVVKC